MSLLDRLDRAKQAAAQAARTAIDLAAGPSVPLPDTDLLLENATLKAELVDYERCARQNKMYYELVENFQTQRDRWKEMFLTQGTENAAAQSFMNAELEKASRIIASVVAVLNADRKAAGKPLFELEHRLETGGTVKKRFDELLAELKATAPPDVDFMKQRDAIAAAGSGGRFTVESGPAGMFKPVFEPCGATPPRTGSFKEAPCAKTVGHEGGHASVYGQKWARE